MGDAPKKFLNLNWFLKGLFAVLFFIVGTNLFIDPWQIFHKPIFRDTYFYSYPQFQNAGVINNYNFTGVIFSSSNGVNISNKMASEIFNEQVVNLSVSGNTILPRTIMLEYALKRHPDLKLVLLSLDFDFEEKHSDLELNDFIRSFKFLYNDSWWDDMRVYASVDLFSCLLINWRCEHSLQGEKRKELDELYRDYVMPWYDNQFGQGIKSWSLDDPTALKHIKRLKRARKKISGNFKSRFTLEEVSKFKKEAREILEKEVVRLIKSYPDVTFKLFFPPISIVYWANLVQGETELFNRHVENARFIVEQTKGLQNVTISALENLPMTDHLFNYKDLIHYNRKFNRKVLESIHLGQYNLTPDNVDEHVALLKQRAKAVDLRTYADLADQKLKTSDSQTF
ncbi:MAG: hypothetical protein KDD61_04285 [Bdellovibrionales bacterium]|nr:hypothetical protein [Bdellovibrionales bacterium]